jgi:hypothetical protein
MNKKLRKLMRRLEAAGAVVGMREDIPDEIAELFIRDIMSCPDCVAAMEATERQKGAGSGEGWHRDGH